ncbi:AAA family ATPase [Paenibacillus nasutitermitis]|uniref:AAA domain-containing protein n=1 Tax=Paenibacillus nasutitermitis TaxID=1652958 RepID=A0A917DXE7_9BACL|nr:AAA family ATPase [Paenibacillus nasutitermitis]GGD76734.1 hypothetical protein GCM10010911_38560 [Paenibacillus nasutitermitis]
MNKRNLIIAVREAEYIERLADYIRHSPFGEDWQLTAFTNPAALRHFIRGGYAVDLIAAQPHMLDELGEQTGAIPLVALVGRSGQYPNAAEVLQYQPLPQLLQALSAVHAATGASTSRTEGEESPVVAVYSAAGGIGKTMLALQLARQAGVRGMRVFYLNLEQWNATSLWLGDEGSEDFPQMLYTLQAQPDKSPLRLSELRKRHATLPMDYFAPSGNAEELLSLSADQTALLIRTIACAGQYDLVIIDLDSRLEELHHAVLQAAGHILWLVSGDGGVLRKTQLALRYGEQKWGNDFLNCRRKFKFINARSLNNDPICEEALKLRLAGSLPFMPEWAGGYNVLEDSGSPAYRGAVESLLVRLAILERGGEDAGGNRIAAKG